MDATKMLVSVSKFAIGWMVGMWVYKSFMSGGSMSSSMPSTDATAPSFGYDGNDY